MIRENEDKCLEDEAKHRKTDAEIKIEFKKLTIGEAIGRFQMKKPSNRRYIAKTDFPGCRAECRYYFQCLAISQRKRKSPCWLAN
jgi:hypothetical protein